MVVIIDPRKEQKMHFFQESFEFLKSRSKSFGPNDRQIKYSIKKCYIFPKKNHAKRFVAKLLFPPRT